MTMETRITTGVAGLDAMLRGGFLPGSAILILGASGTGKTSLALQFLLAGARKGETGLFISFEAFPQALYRDAHSLGFDLRAWEAQGRLHIVFTSPEVLLESLEHPEDELFQRIAAHDVRRVVIDSVTHVQRLTLDGRELRRHYTALVNALRREGVTALLLSEEQRAAYRRTNAGGLPHLCDGVVLLRLVEVESAMQRAIAVLKVRGSDHAREIRHYQIREGGLAVGEVFRRREAILSGISRRR